ncbi:MAG: hypothetical protein ACPGO5_05440 [Patescibacteria group bacterium]
MEVKSRNYDREDLEPRWVPPSLEEELGELQNAAENLGIDERVIISAFESGALEELADEDWSSMVNADSRDESWTLPEVRDWIKERNNLQSDNDRKVDMIIEGFEAGASLPAATVLYRHNERPYLIGGNTRLLVARGKGIRPHVFALRLNEKENVE